MDNHSLGFAWSPETKPSLEVCKKEGFGCPCPALSPRGCMHPRRDGAKAARRTCAANPGDLQEMSWRASTGLQGKKYFHHHFPIKKRGFP